MENELRAQGSIRSVAALKGCGAEVHPRLTFVPDQDLYKPRDAAEEAFYGVPRLKEQGFDVARLAHASLLFRNRGSESTLREAFATLPAFQRRLAEQRLKRLGTEQWHFPSPKAFESLSYEADGFGISTLIDLATATRSEEQLAALVTLDHALGFDFLWPIVLSALVSLCGLLLILPRVRQLKTPSRRAAKFIGYGGAVLATVLFVLWPLSPALRCVSTGEAFEFFLRGVIWSIPAGFIGTVLRSGRMPKAALGVVLFALCSILVSHWASALVHLQVAPGDHQDIRYAFDVGVSNLFWVWDETLRNFALPATALGGLGLWVATIFVRHSAECS